jgi:RimJ/RimL family protein N-acetyltransferase
MFIRCFGDPEWRKLYGVSENADPQLEIIDRLRPYPFVDRYVATDPHIGPFGLLVYDRISRESSRCVASAGLRPDLIGSGWGVRLVLIGCQFAFESLGVTQIDAIPRNPHSARILSRLGFSKRQTNKDQTASLVRSEFPNSFAWRLLERYKCH